MILRMRAKAIAAKRAEVRLTLLTLLLGSNPNTAEHVCVSDARGILA